MKTRSPVAILSEEVKNLSSNQLAGLISALPIWDEENDRPNRELALALADTLSVEQAQHLYRFAVLVTKLA